MRDPETGGNLVIDDMTYSEWEKQEKGLLLLQEKRIIKSREGITYGEKIQLGVGAKSRSFPKVVNPYTGKDIEFVPGTRPIYPADKVIAGYKCKHSNPIKYAEEIMDKYGIEGDPKKLSKQKAYYEAYDKNGQINMVEIHFYTHPSHDGGFGYKVKIREGAVFVD